MLLIPVFSLLVLLRFDFRNFDPGIHQAQNDKITSNCRFCPMASWCCSTWATLLAWPHVSRKQGNSRILMWKDVKVSRTRRNWHFFRWSDSSLFMMFCGFASLCKPPNRSGFVWFCCKNSWPDETISTWAKICFIIHILLYSNILSSILCTIYIYLLCSSIRIIYIYITCCVLQQHPATPLVSRFLPRSSRFVWSTSSDAKEAL